MLVILYGCILTLLALILVMISNCCEIEKVLLVSPGLAVCILIEITERIPLINVLLFFLQEL